MPSKTLTWLQTRTRTGLQSHHVGRHIQIFSLQRLKRQTFNHSQVPQNYQRSGDKKKPLCTLHKNSRLADSDWSSSSGSPQKHLICGLRSHRLVKLWGYWLCSPGRGSWYNLHHHRQSSPLSSPRTSSFVKGPRAKWSWQPQRASRLRRPLIVKATQCQHEPVWSTAWQLWSRSAMDFCSRQDSYRSTSRAENICLPWRQSPSQPFLVYDKLMKCGNTVTRCEAS